MKRAEEASEVRREEPARGDSSESGAPSIEFYRELVNGMTCGVLTVNRAGIVTTLNDHARAILNLGSQGVLGASCDDLLAHCPRLGQLLRESFAMSSPPTRLELQIPMQGRRRARTIGFSISMIASPQDGRIEGAALFFKDLTRVEEQAERERLRDRLAALGEMAAQMAHEIRNPLTSIQVSVSLMQRRLVSRGEPTDLLPKIAAEVARIETTIANCLEYARPLTPDLRPTEPAALLDEAISLAGLRAGSEGVVIERAYAPGMGQILCDRALVKEGLINILVNAYEAIDGRGTITVSTEAVPGRLPAEAAGSATERSARLGQSQDPAPALGSVSDCAASAAKEPLAAERFLSVRVTDTGKGIEPELLDRVFYPFFTTKTAGSGIGLAVARKVVESHGGLMDVESEPERGTTFTIKLPLVEQDREGSRT